MVAAGHEVEVFTGDTQPIGQRHDLRTEIYDELTVHRVHLTAVDWASDYVNFSHPPVEVHFSRVLADFRPDVVHCHNIIGLSVTILHVAREFGARVLMTLHDHWAFCFKNTIMKTEGVACVDYSRCDECMPFIDDGGGRRLPMRMRQDFMKLAMDAVDAFVSPSQYLADSYIQAGFAPDKMHVIWNGIDVDKFATIVRKPLQGKLRFSFFGNFGRHKGIHTLFEALPLLKDPNSVQINLIGDGNERAAYEQQLLENGCTGLVKFWGKLDNGDVARAYAETDVLVLPSIWHENQPVSITEAMACGVPVIGSNMGGIPELVEDGVSGFIFEAGNATDLAEKMDQLIDDSVLVKTMGLNGHKKICDVTFARQVEALLGIYGIAGDRSHDADDVPLIVCVGQRVGTDCAQAMAHPIHYLNGAQPYMLMANWLTASQLRQARLGWVVDAAASEEDIEGLLLSRLPLLLPECNDVLAPTCRQHGCGLHYRDANDAAACIARTLTRRQDP